MAEQRSDRKATRPMKKLLLLLTTIVACGGPARDETPASIAVATSAPPETSVPAPVALTPVFIETGSPHSTCRLSLDPQSSDVLNAVSDHNGIVTLHVSDPDGSPDVTYACTDGTGKATKGSTTSAKILGAQARLTALAATLPPDARILPALAGDLTAISQESLLARGYPPRPDAAATAAYADWVKTVSHANTFIPPHPSPAPARANSPTSGTDTTWGGIVLNAAPGNPYWSVFGYWNVPGATPVNGPYTFNNNGYFMLTKSSLWVGLGFTTSSLVQSGTEEDSTFVYTQSTNRSSFITSTYTWNEFVPNLQAALNLQVSPGDSVSFHSWIGDSTGRATLGGHYAWTYIINSTRNFVTSNAQQAPAGTVFDGSTVEWSVEPTEFCSGSSVSTCHQGFLTDFGTASIFGNSFAQAADSSIHQWFTEPGYVVNRLVASNGTVKSWAWTGDANDTPYPYGLHFQWQSP